MKFLASWGRATIDTEKLFSRNRTDMLIFDLFVTWGGKKNQCLPKGKDRINRERHLLFKPSERVLKHDLKK